MKQEEFVKTISKLVQQVLHEYDLPDVPEAKKDHVRNMALTGLVLLVIEPDSGKSQFEGLLQSVAAKSQDAQLFELMGYSFGYQLGVLLGYFDPDDPAILRFFTRLVTTCYPLNLSYADFSKERS